ncbi:MAG TPA: hypothetical protein VGB85_12030, partial [Nannocystis sp.]
ERALDSPAVDLDGLASGLERRLCAHLDALLVAGPRVAAKLLLPALADDDPERAFAAALALLAAPEPAHGDAVLRAWSTATPRRRKPLTRALTVAPAAPRRPELRAALTAADASLRAAAIEVLGFRRALQPRDLDPLRLDPDPAVRHALVRAAGRDPTLDLRSLVRDALHAQQPEHLAAALASAAILGLPELPAARQQARARDDEAGALALLLTAFTDPAALLAELDRPRAVFALGFTGSFAAAEACVRCIRDGKHPALAFEAFTALTSADLRHAATPDDDALPELADEDLTADIASGPEDDLPLPDPDLVQAWWRANADRLPRPRLPTLADDRRGLLLALRHAPMRRRHALALRLAIVTAGAAQLETRAPALRQRTALQRLAGT